ncbi:hypothetical protein DVH24_028800 [Malus domestica]|uniref:Reverse transcriptase Ty1/copia-type domain-containing protein n=1 Tax=Malus domestica TaxID=3750 RepID=A0A498IVS1_MALDO|nr:hypothetical protein DVH24_028800 [Malus domestica]
MVYVHLYAALDPSSVGITGHLAWVRNILKDIGVRLFTPPVIHCDNISAIALSANPIRIITLFERGFKKCDLEVSYIPTDEQIADILTKGLYSPAFVQHCYNLKLRNPS